LPSARRSGLLEAIDILQGVNGLAFVHFDESDVVRHHLVQRIIRAYDEYKVRLAEPQLSLLEGKAGTETKAVNGKNGDAEARVAPLLEEPHEQD
jgi:phosphate starvation-inducible PhoH-like protein